MRDAELDPEAAEFLRSVASEMPHDEYGQVYDGMRVLARMVKFYGISDERFDNMDYMRFFGMLREKRVYEEEEQDAHHRALQGEQRGLLPDQWGDDPGT